MGAITLKATGFPAQKASVPIARPGEARAMVGIIMESLKGVQACRCGDACRR